MKILRYGDTGPQVEFLQLALQRAGYDPGVIDGVFGVATLSALRAFQREYGLVQDGVFGPRSAAAIRPFMTGYLTYTIRAGDTLYEIAARMRSSVRALETANPGINPLNLRIGSFITVPLMYFDVTPTNISYSSALVELTVDGLAARYPFLTTGSIGNSVMGKPIYWIGVGEGENKVLYNASHHANEWITTPVMLKFVEDFSKAYVGGDAIYGRPAQEIFAQSQIIIVPAVNPDGIDLVTGDLKQGEEYEQAKRLSAYYPNIPFPSGWKANIAGTDLNLQYPAGWDVARDIKFEQGFTRPGPRDFVGTAPLSAPESRAMYNFTVRTDPELVLAYHTQGQVIYWKYLDYEPERSREIAERFALSSGYAVEETPYGSGHAGYKDWFIFQYDRPGYTIEAGLGESPLPITQFDKIYADNLGILVLGAVLTI